jgi:peptide chain release factor subunit 1
LHKIDVTCNRCQHIQEDIVERSKVIPRKTELLNTPCPKCNATDLEASERDIVDYLALIATKTGTDIEVVSGTAEHGAMLSSLGKIGAILRYNPGHTAA